MSQDLLSPGGLERMRLHLFEEEREDIDHVKFRPMTVIYPSPEN
jgi:hypothetical protein